MNIWKCLCRLCVYSSSFGLLVGLMTMMTMIEEVMLNLLLGFLSNMTLTFLLGIQSKNVNQSRYLAAAITSLGISVCNYAFIKIAIHGDAVAFLIMALGGAVGILLSIFAHDAFSKSRKGEHGPK